MEKEKLAVAKSIDEYLARLGPDVRAIFQIVYVLFFITQLDAIVKLVRKFC